MKIGLVLGAGGARGLAHIGALRAIEEAGHEPVAVAGASMGAFIGAMAAAGHDAARIERAVTDHKRFTVPSPGRRGGLLGHDRILDAFRKDLPEQIDALNLPFAAIAVDISSGEVVVIDSGPLRPALAASIALPGLLDPVKRGDRHLVDGGVVNALPVDVVRNMTEAPVVAVDVTPDRTRVLSFAGGAPWWRRAWDRITFKRRPLAMDVLLKAFAIQQSLLTDRRLREHPPDVYVDVPLPPDVRLEDFHRYEEVIEVGHRSTQAALEERPDE